MFRGSRGAAGALLAQTGTGGAIYKQNPSSIGAALKGATIATYGNSAPHENRTPYLVMNWCIALSGIYPSRN